MNGTVPVGVLSPSVALVSDETYYSTLHWLIEKSTICCYASLFIVDLNPHHDPDAKVLQVLKAFQDAMWRGTEIKLLIGGSHNNLAINEASHIAKQVALSLGIECRLLSNQEQRGSHVKVVIVDDFVLSGSHNWSSGAFSGQIQDSILVESQSMAAYMRAAFNDQWSRAGTGE